MQIGVADPASLDFHNDLAGTGVWNDDGLDGDGLALGKGDNTLPGGPPRGGRFRSSGE
ncbi:hypothetical protein [Streptomyces rapamycinicus]|uniref:Uncharacterized protein n=1 Tax=Streptomyces rapamycinicus TaxID=1226757 RepID=A0ABR6LYH4_9ACTN|nr:hypothetical protein [Streptomyces rapamycinicus]MBB4787405.1 hypothetical protein [Streptomyces rapamycinicus]UTP36871.1 hypothetical protein LIV37_51240 [Streptomyces rapamycinicus NRRL 5491]